MTAPGSILLVDDNPMDVDLALRAFKRHKPTCPIEVARDGEEALAWIPRWESGEPRPSVMLLDLKMSRVSGLEVLRHLKAHPVYSAIPVVVLSTSAAGQDVQEAYALGANSYIVKPTDFDRFLDVAGQVLSYWTSLNLPPE